MCQVSESNCDRQCSVFCWITHSHCQRYLLQPWSKGQPLHALIKFSVSKQAHHVWLLAKISWFFLPESQLRKEASLQLNLIWQQKFWIACFHLASWRPCWCTLKKIMLIISFVWDSNMATTPIVICVSWDCVKTKNWAKFSFISKLYKQLCQNWKWSRNSKSSWKWKSSEQKILAI